MKIVEGSYNLIIKQTMKVNLASVTITDIKDSEDILGFAGGPEKYTVTAAKEEGGKEEGGFTAIHLRGCDSRLSVEPI